MEPKPINPGEKPVIHNAIPSPSKPRNNPPSVPKGTSEPVDTVSLSSQGRKALEESGALSGQTQNGETPLRKFSVTDDNQVILKMINRETKQVVKQIPSEGEVRLREAIQNVVENLNLEDPNNPPQA